jgi:hypothetical protein
MAAAPNPITVLNTLKILPMVGAWGLVAAASMNLVDFPTMQATASKWDSMHDTVMRELPRMVKTATFPCGTDWIADDALSFRLATGSYEDELPKLGAIFHNIAEHIRKMEVMYAGFWVLAASVAGVLTARAIAYRAAMATPETAAAAQISYARDLTWARRLLANRTAQNGAIVAAELLLVSQGTRHALNDLFNKSIPKVDRTVPREYASRPDFDQVPVTLNPPTAWTAPLSRD